ncbi:hypothetical protein [Pseudomonas syringae]|uniref:hypothetical protein n=1 Tax=Pseudomonas syringae TaxID=317 RepID=UPI0012903035|nr:hypothetical protein [Pseudomonas syringae]
MLLGFLGFLHHGSGVEKLWVTSVGLVLSDGFGNQAQSNARFGRSLIKSHPAEVSPKPSVFSSTKPPTARKIEPPFHHVLESV